MLFFVRRTSGHLLVWQKHALDAPLVGRHEQLKRHKKKGKRYVTHNVSSHLDSKL